MTEPNKYGMYVLECDFHLRAEEQQAVTACFKRIFDEPPERRVAVLGPGMRLKYVSPDGWTEMECPPELKIEVRAEKPLIPVEPGTEYASQ